RRHWLHFNPWPFSVRLTGALQRGQTRIFRSSGLTAIEGIIIYCDFQPPIESDRLYGRLAPQMATRVLLAILFTAISAYATTVQRLGLEDLAKKAHTIVVGRVTNSRTYWSPNGKVIFTNYTFQVDESIKGQAGRNVEITTIGGRIGEVELHV